MVLRLCLFHIGNLNMKARFDLLANWNTFIEIYDTYNDKYRIVSDIVDGELVYNWEGNKPIYSPEDMIDNIQTLLDVHPNLAPKFIDFVLSTRFHIEMCVI